MILFSPVHFSAHRMTMNNGLILDQTVPEKKYVLSQLQREILLKKIFCEPMNLRT